jgi:hypothetical protein
MAITLNFMDLAAVASVALWLLRGRIKNDDFLEALDNARVYIAAAVGLYCVFRIAGHFGFTP